MLSAKENERLTRVGPGTPGGELMRCYWQPVAALQELDEMPTKQVRLLGEDLVLYRDLDGTLGLLDVRCPHRGASLVYGMSESPGIRCPYHGWRFDEKGTCIEQPNEFRFYPNFRKRGATRAYPVAVVGGLVLAYLGPEPAPLVPDWHVMTDDPGPNSFVDIAAAIIPCNWLQIQENSLDPTHTEWLHGRFFNRLLEQQGEAPTSLGAHHIKIGFDEFEHGIIQRRLLEGMSEDDERWRVGHPAVFPNILYIGGNEWSQLQIRVPVDDVNTYHVWYTVYNVPPEHGVLISQMKNKGKFFTVPIYEDGTGRLLVDHIDGQDIMAWVTQGPIADRSRELLGQADRGITLFRQMLKRQMDTVATGADPMNVFRDPEALRNIELHGEKSAQPAMKNTTDALAPHLRGHARYSPAVTELVQLVAEHDRDRRAVPVAAGFS